MGLSKRKIKRLHAKAASLEACQTEWGRGLRQLRILADVPARIPAKLAGVSARSWEKAEVNGAAKVVSRYWVILALAMESGEIKHIHSKHNRSVKKSSGKPVNKTARLNFGAVKKETAAELKARLLAQVEARLEQWVKDNQQ